MSFGYQVLGFGSGGGPTAYTMDMLVVAGGAGGAMGAGGAGGYRTFSPVDIPTDTTVTVAVGGGGPAVHL